MDRQTDILVELRLHKLLLCLVYVEFGATSTDTVTLTNTYVSSGLTTAKKYNILARQISCTAEWK